MQGAVIKVIPFEELLTILNVTVVDIEAMPYPDEECFVKKQNNKVHKKESTKTIYTCKSASTTIGDLLKTQKIVLSPGLNDADVKYLIT